MGEDPLGDHGDPSLTMFKNGLTPKIVSQRMTSRALSKTEPGGDILQLIVCSNTAD